MFRIIVILQSFRITTSHWEQNQFSSLEGVQYSIAFPVALSTFSIAIKNFALLEFVEVLLFFDSFIGSSSLHFFFHEQGDN